MYIKLHLNQLAELENSTQNAPQVEYFRSKFEKFSWGGGTASFLNLSPSGKRDSLPIPYPSEPVALAAVNSPGSATAPDHPLSDAPIVSIHSARCQWVRTQYSKQLSMASLRGFHSHCSLSVLSQWSHDSAGDETTFWLVS